MLAEKCHDKVTDAPDKVYPGTDPAFSIDWSKADEHATRYFAAQAELSKSATSATPPKPPPKATLYFWDGRRVEFEPQQNCRLFTWEGAERWYEYSGVGRKSKKAD